MDLSPDVPEVPNAPSAADAERRRVEEDARQALGQGGRGASILTQGRRLGLKTNMGASGGGPLRPTVNMQSLTRGRS